MYLIKKGKEREKKRKRKGQKKQISPHLFLIFSLFLPHFHLVLLWKKKLKA